jgi:hypothetical protein
MIGLTFSPVALILQRMPDVEKSSTYNCNDRRISDGEFPSRASVKRNFVPVQLKTAASFCIANVQETGVDLL